MSKRKSKIFSEYEMENIIEPLIEQAYKNIDGTTYPYHIDFEDITLNDTHEYTALVVRISEESNSNKSATGAKKNGYYVIIDHEADVGVASKGMARFRKTYKK